MKVCFISYSLRLVIAIVGCLYLLDYLINAKRLLYLFFNFSLLVIVYRIFGIISGIVLYSSSFF